MSDENRPQRTLIIRPNARNDIERITDYIADNSSVAKAVQFQNAVAGAIENLLMMPYMGALKEVRNPSLQDLRKFIVPEFRQYLIFYLTPEGNIEVVRVLHSSQNTDAILEAEVLD
jgi:plasmid stabilization system protein ParE